MKNKLIRVILIAILMLPIFSSISLASSKDLHFTPEEKAFIQKHPEIHLGVDPKFIPYEFIDSDGVYKGIAADYIKLLSERTGLKMTVAKDLTWPEAYEKAVVRDLDVLPCVAKTREREKYFLYSEPYYTFQRVIYVKDNNTSINSLDDLNGLKVAVQKDSSHNSFLANYPGIKLSLYTNAEDALRAVASGEEIAFVGNLATSNYLIRTYGFTDLKYIKLDAGQETSLYFAVRSDWPELVSIINKGLESITAEEKLSITNQWIGVEENVDYARIIRIAGMVGAVIIFAFLISLYWIALLRKEVAKRRKIEQELQIAKDEAESANHIKSIFLARMSHEIRTPLNAITGMTYLMKKTDVNMTQKSYLDKIAQASNNMLGIINDILDFSKIEAGKIEIEKIPFSLDRVLVQVINLIALKIEEKNIDFSIVKDPHIPTFYLGDPTRIEQVLLNIINNAVKFTQTGAISLSIQLVKKENDFYTIEFTVKDTGIGMSEEQASQIFKPFDQGEASISRRFGGTGLGLSIAKQLLDLMGGNIEVSSVLNEGSVFTIHLTMEEDTSQELEDKYKTASVYFKDIRVLVLDKSTFYTNLLREYLQSFNMIAEFAATEEEALYLMENACSENTQPYNLLILDHNTPSDGGINFYNHLKQWPGIQEVPKCILMIPLTREDLFENLISAGIDFGINKPILPSILYNAIVEIFKIEMLTIHDSSALNKKLETLVVNYPYHVLIVEDNKINQFIAQSILEQSGFVASVAENGKEGYDFFIDHQNDLDVILMDLHMPVLNGFEATALIRAKNDHIPIIAMTADAITGIEEQCQNIGINYYISKPFDPEKFVDTIMKVLHSQKEAAQSNTDNDVQNAAISETKPALDVAAGLKLLGGKADLYNHVLEEYYKESKEVPSILRKTLKERNDLEAIQIVHKIKSSSGNIGANQLHQTASELQKSLSEGNTEEITRLHQEFQRQLQQVLQEIQLRLK